MGELSISFGAVVVAPPKFLIAFPFDGFFSLSLSHARACVSRWCGDRVREESEVSLWLVPAALSLSTRRFFFCFSMCVCIRSFELTVVLSLLLADDVSRLLVSSFKFHPTKFLLLLTVCFFLLTSIPSDFFVCATSRLG
jgi:hypothetical protein